MTETWKPCPRASGHVVSDEGNVRRINTFNLGAYLVPGVRNKRRNYLSVTVTEDDGKKRSRALHRLVCEAFNGPPPHENTACVFLDRDNRNFDPANLAWESLSVANLTTRHENGTGARLT